VQVVLEGDAMIECVPEEMNQVLTNLVQNALDAMPQDGRGVVRLRGSVESGEVTLSVRDNGPGIPPEHRAKIFTPFFTTKDVGKGSGLGLFVVYEIIDEHDGSIAVGGAPGGGTLFTIRLPA
jgi:signal transduction histidine kinase